MRNPGPHGLCNGDHPWRQAPPDAGRPLKHTGEPFGGAGVLAQWSTAKQKGFRLPTWMTFSTVREHGGRLLGGTAPVTVFHGCTRPVVTVSAETGEGVVRTVETWRPYTVFNVEEVEGLPRHLYRSYGDPSCQPSPEEGLDDFVQTLGVDLHLYDRVGGPAPVQRDYRHTGIVREVVWWSGHPARLNRRVEDEIVDAGMSLAGEELVCEIATVFLSADLGVRMHQGSVVGSAGKAGWSRLLTGDEMAIFRACRDASRAVDWLHRRSPGFRIDPAMAQDELVLEPVDDSARRIERHPVLDPQVDGRIALRDPDDHRARQARQPHARPLQQLRERRRPRHRKTSHRRRHRPRRATPVRLSQPDLPGPSGPRPPCGRPPPAPVWGRAPSHPASPPAPCAGPRCSADSASGTARLSPLPCCS